MEACYIGIAYKIAFKTVYLFLMQCVFVNLDCNLQTQGFTFENNRRAINRWGQVQLIKYSSTSITQNKYQVQVQFKYSLMYKVLKYIKY